MRMLLAIICLALLLPGYVLAQQDNMLAKWKQEENQCIAACPKFPSFGGTESEESYQLRMEQEDAFNSCFYQCTSEYLNKVRPYRPKFDDGSEGYFNRNTPQEQ